MAFLLEEDGEMRAFEAALSFVDAYVLDAQASDDTLATAIPAEEAVPGDRRPQGQLELPADAEDSDLSIYSNGDGGAMPLLQPADSNQSVQTGDGDCMDATAASLSTSNMATKQRRAVANAKRKLLRKAGMYGDPNRARNERKLEILYLRDKLRQLELELSRLQQQPSPRVLQVASIPELAQGGQEQAEVGNIVPESTALLSADSQSPGVWRGVAGRQRLRREKAERENIRLKLILEGQIKVARSLKMLLEKRARQHGAECLSIKNPSILQGRSLDYHAGVADFQELLGHLDAAYREVDAVFAANGLATMELSQQDIHMREGINGMYLEVFANKAIPFDLRSTAEATWQYFKGAEKHRGNLYEKAAKNLETPFTIIEDFAKELFAGSARTDVRVKQIVRRYVEADREIVIWVATVAPTEITHKPFAGLTFHHRGYALIKRAAASTPQQELSLLQLCTLATLDNEEGAIYDHKYVRALTDLVLSNAAENIKADQELIENVLMDEPLHCSTAASKEA